MANGRYATKTRVSVDRSKIDSTLRRYGVEQFGYGWEASRQIIYFGFGGWLVRFLLVMPDPDSDEFRLTPTGRQRPPDSADNAYQQAVKQRWRALVLIIKAKLEAIESGITTFEEEFLSYMVLPDNTRVGKRVLPMIEDSYRTGEMPPPS